MLDGSILIAGSSGFLGSSLSDFFRQHGLPVVDGVRLHRLQRLPAGAPPAIAVDGSVPQLTADLQQHRVTAIINCITDYGKSGSAPVIESNLLLPVRLLDACASSEVATFINCNTSLPSRVNDYALAKQQFSGWLQRQAAVPRVIDVQLEYFYGELEPSSRLVRRMIDVSLDPSEQMPLSPGEQERDFVHVLDVCSAMQTLLTDPKVPDGYHRPAMGSGRAISLKQLGSKIQELCPGPCGQLQYGAVDYRPREVMRSCADLSWMNRWGWSPKINIDEGLTRCIQHVQRQRSAA